MTLRFASNPVPFARRTIELPAGHALTPAQLAQLVAYHTTGASDVAVVCKDRPTLLAITKAFRSALRPSSSVPATATTVAPVAQDTADLTDALVLARGALVSANARLAEAQAEIVALKAQLAAKPKARRSRAKAAAAVAELVTGEGYTDTEPAS